MQVRPDDLQRHEDPQRSPCAPAPAGQQQEERRCHEVGEDMRALHETGRGQDHHERQGADGGRRRGPELDRRGVEQSRDRDRRHGLQEDEPVEPEGTLDQPQHDGRQPFVRHVGTAPGERGIVVGARHRVRLEDELARLEVQEQVVVGDRGDIQGEQQQGERQKGGRFAAPGRSGRHQPPYLSREAMSALTDLPSTRPRCRPMNSFMARPRSFFSVTPISLRRASTACASSSALMAAGR